MGSVDGSAQVEGKKIYPMIFLGKTVPIPPFSVSRCPYTLINKTVFLHLILSVL